MSAVATAAPMARAGAAAQDGPAAISGVWKLNAAASVNPNGPPAVKPAQAPRGGGGGGGGSVDVTGGATQQIQGGIGKEEEARLNAAKAFFFKAPEMMGIQATKDEFKLLLDPATKLGFAHKTDNKKAKVATPAGPMDFKVKWDGQKLVREAEMESLKVIETYTVSPDGKQLIVTVKADSTMVRNVQNGEIKRVYEKQPQ
ncbi:MAG TPA: hypothetical protein VFV98_18560 [Vicinamibacterales bacterium]|nr:hypothetical protein [Vicinamibacterales bacterium]